MGRQSKGNIVYSTDGDWLKKQQAPEKQTNKSSASAAGIASIQRERKGRGGKVVTVISGLTGDVKPLQKELQKHCGTGGTCKGSTIEIQGDHRDKIAAYLKDRGIKSKFVGG